MTLLQAFKAYLPKPDNFQMNIAPPYDVLDSSQAQQIAAKSDYNIVHVTRPEVDCPGKPYDDPNCYRTARMNLEKLLNAQYQKPSKQPHYLIYQMTKGTHRQTGIVGKLHLDANTHHRLKTHEHTQPQKVTDRSRLLQAVQAQISPVLLTVRKAQALSSSLEPMTQQHLPLYQIEDEQHYLHQIWSLSPLQSQELARKLSRIEKYYIADGHHRCAAALEAQKTQPQQEILGVVFPAEELRILGYHRVIQCPNVPRIIEQLAQKFKINPMQERRLPTRKNQFGLYYGKQWYALELQEEDLSAADLLHRRVIQPYLGIVNPRQDARIDFIGGETAIQQIERLIDETRFDLGFTLYPTQIETILNAADANEVMPPKSTWFEPKLLDGFFIAK